MAGGGRAGGLPAAPLRLKMNRPRCAHFTYPRTLLPLPPPLAVNYGLNVMCLRRDLKVHAGLLREHKKYVEHCLAGQGLYGYV